MTADVKNVYAAAPLITGSLRVGPLTTPAPTDATSTLDAGFVDLGYIGEQGFTERLQRTTNKKRSLGGKVIKVLQTEFSAMLTVTLCESLQAEALKAVYGAANVTVTPANATHGNQVEIHKNGIKLPHLSWVMDTTDEELTAFYRSYIPDGQVLTVGDVKVVHTDTIEYPLEIECYEDASGEHIYTFTDDGQITS